MLPFVGNEKQDISQQSPVSLITKLPSFKPTSIAGVCSTHGMDDNSWKSFVGQANGEKKFGRPMRTWEVKY